MSNGNGHRWSKFWWCDWQNDKALQRCSLAARGLWIEMLAICHDSERPGYLLINGEPPDDEALADILGKTTVKEISKLLEELERRKVFSRDEQGIIFSRRMVKDTAASAQASEWGKRGGNPVLNPQGGLTPPVNPKLGNGVNPDPYPPPLNQKLEAEEEAEEEPLNPHGVGTGTPAEPGTPPTRRANGTNPRTLGTNPREILTNPRANGTDTRTTGANPRNSRNVFHERARQAAVAPIIIEPTTEEMAEVRAFHLKLVGGNHG